MNVDFEFLYWGPLVIKFKVEEYITKELLETKIAKGFSIGQIAVQIGKSKTATNHHFKKYNLKTLAQEREEQGLKYCPCCKEYVTRNVVGYGLFICIDFPKNYNTIS